MSAGKDEEFQLDGARLTRLLNLGMLEQSRPVDNVLNRLRERDGAEWLRAALRTSPAAAFGPPEEKLAPGTLPLDALKSIKEAAKDVFSKAQVREDRLAALLAYFLAAAAALAGHGALIVSLGRDELDPILLDLSGALPDPWAGLLARALRS